MTALTRVHFANEFRKREPVPQDFRLKAVERMRKI